MSDVLNADAYSFSVLSVPYVVLTLGVLVEIFYLLFTRGNPQIRTSLMALLLLALTFTVGQSITASCIDPDVALTLSRFYIGPISLIGPAGLALQLALVERLHNYRMLLAVSVILATATCLLTWMTDWTITGIWQTRWGLYYVKNGMLSIFHVGNIVSWGLVGAVLGARSVKSDLSKGRRQRVRRMMASSVLLVLCANDTLLGFGIGVYPTSWFPGFLAVGVTMHSLFRTDLIRVRGRDNATHWELLVVGALGVLVFFIYGATRDAQSIGSSIAAVIVIAPLMAAAQFAASAIRGRQQRSSRADRELDLAVDRYAAVCTEVQSEHEIVQASRELFEDQLGLSQSRLFVVGETGLVLAGQDDETVAGPVRFDARVRAWIMANRQPLVWERLAAQRLGGLRAPIESFMSQFRAEVAIPLVDREQLVGLLVTGPRQDERAISDALVEVLLQVQAATARALTYLRLYQEAEERVEVAREVEVAAAVENARVQGSGHETVGPWDIFSYYKPAGQFGGDWWMCDTLADGRLLIAVGAVGGTGVPAALVTATVEGCCETAQHLLGANFEVLSLLQMLNRSVSDVGRNHYVMSCFVAVFDPADQSVTYANAGHRFPYVIRAGKEGRGSLSALVSRGMPLGVEKNPTIAVAKEQLTIGDTVVLYTDVLVESENSAQVPYGERRLQRVLRGAARRAGDDVCTRSSPTTPRRITANGLCAATSRSYACAPASNDRATPRFFTAKLLARRRDGARVCSPHESSRSHSYPSSSCAHDDSGRQHVCRPCSGRSPVADGFFAPRWR